MRWTKKVTRALDKEGNTIEFMLAAKRDISAVKRFFKRMMRAAHGRLPFSVSGAKHAAYPDAFAASQEEKVLPLDCKLRRTKYLTNRVEQDHRFIRRRWRAMQAFRSCHTAERTLEGVEALDLMRKGQLKRISAEDAKGQVKFVESLFQRAA